VRSGAGRPPMPRPPSTTDCAPPTARSTRFTAASACDFNLGSPNQQTGVLTRCASIASPRACRRRPAWSALPTGCRPTRT
jgi:hypothetical protein